MSIAMSSIQERDLYRELTADIEHLRVRRVPREFDEKITYLESLTPSMPVRDALSRVTNIIGYMDVQSSCWVDIARRADAAAKQVHRCGHWPPIRLHETLDPATVTPAARLRCGRVAPNPDPNCEGHHMTAAESRGLEAYRLAMLADPTRNNVVRYIERAARNYIRVSESQVASMIREHADQQRNALRLMDVIAEFAAL